MSYTVLIFCERPINNLERWGNVVKITEDQGDYVTLMESYQDNTLQPILDVGEDLENFKGELDSVCSLIRSDILKSNINIEAVGIIKRIIDQNGEEFYKVNIIWSLNSSFPDYLEGNFGVTY